MSLEEMKNYLRVDFEDDDALLTEIIGQSQQICMDVALMKEEVTFQKNAVVTDAIGNHVNA